MMLPRPTRVEIGAKPFSIEIDPFLQLHEQVTGCMGLCKAQEQRIKMIPCLTAECQEELLYHEVTEAINTVWFQDALDHATIARLGEAWCQAMRSMGITFDWSGVVPDGPPIPEPELIEDGFGSVSARCPKCGGLSMVVVRPGKVQCNNCG